MTHKIAAKLQPWIDARKRHHLSHSVVQMARELGLNPHKLGNIDNHRQETWKIPLSQFITDLYEKRFGQREPVKVLSIEEIAKLQAEKKRNKRAAKKVVSSEIQDLEFPDK